MGRTRQMAEWVGCLGAPASIGGGGGRSSCLPCWKGLSSEGGRPLPRAMELAGRRRGGHRELRADLGVPGKAHGEGW